MNIKFVTMSKNQFIYRMFGNNNARDHECVFFCHNSKILRRSLKEETPDEKICI